jgi:hypothetical protein
LLSEAAASHDSGGATAGVGEAELEVGIGCLTAPPPARGRGHRPATPGSARERPWSLPTANRWIDPWSVEAGSVMLATGLPAVTGKLAENR